MGMKSFGKLAAIALLVTSAAIAAESRAGIAQGMDAVLAVERALPMGADPAPPLRRAFSESLGGISTLDLQSLSDEDLRFYVSAANVVAFYTFDKTYLDHVEDAFAVLESRRSVSQFDFATMFKAYVQFREFARAHSLAARYPAMEHEPLPVFEGFSAPPPAEPMVMVLAAGGIITRVPANLAAQGPQVVVAAHPLCHFSENAVRSIRDDEELAGLFAGRTLWLMPQDRYLNVEVVRDWNREYPGYAMKWAYRTADWPMIERWATPNFYFFRDGKLVSTVIGWPPEGRRAELIDAFRAIGVVPATSAQRSR